MIAVPSALIACHLHALHVLRVPTHCTLPLPFCTGGDVVSVLYAAFLGGFAIGQAAPNLQYFIQASDKRLWAAAILLLA